MEMQAKLHVQAARAPWNSWLWQPPQVVYYSTLVPWAPEVAERLSLQVCLFCALSA